MLRISYVNYSTKNTLWNRIRKLIAIASDFLSLDWLPLKHPNTFWVQFVILIIYFLYFNHSNGILLLLDKLQTSLWSGLFLLFSLHFHYSFLNTVTLSHTELIEIPELTLLFCFPDVFITFMSFFLFFFKWISLFFFVGYDLFIALYLVFLGNIFDLFYHTSQIVHALLLYSHNPQSSISPMSKLC